MSHIGGQDDGELHQTGKLAILEPGLLVDQLLLPGFVDGIGICFAGCQHPLDDLDATGLMAIVEAVSNQFFSAMGGIYLGGFVVHFDHDGVFIANRDRHREFLDPFVHLELFEDVRGNDGSLNLIGSFVDLQDFGITHHLFYGIFFHVAISTEDLDGIGGNLHRHV